jgi:predicted metal-binding membrane protein
MEAVLKRDRWIVFAALAGITGLAWWWMAQEARGMEHGSCCNMVAPDTNPWDTATLLPLFFMWSEMMVAMMIPSAAPMILTFAAVNRKRREQDRPYVPTGIFLAGYLAVWTAFSAFAALLQWFLHAKTLLTPMMTGTSPLLGGGLFVAAGIFQFTPLKNACLRHCRSPLGFLLADWREGRTGAFVMGLKHGTYCTGCCWFLMLLLFVVGVMNVLWIAALTLFVLLEKVVPHGPRAGWAAGVGMIGWGVWTWLAAF